MTMFLILLIATCLAYVLLRGLRSTVGSAPASRPASRGARQAPAPDRADAREGAGTTPQAFEWDANVPLPPPLEGEALQRRLRERYIAARFPGQTNCVVDLDCVDAIVRAARHYYEEEKFEEADELLALASARRPEDEALQLARIEIAFLVRESAHFVSLAEEFHRRLPGSPHWPEVARLGRVISPSHPAFAAAPGSLPSETYGPWPAMPNWINAPWDLTAEVLASDFHRAILRRPQMPPATRRRLIA